MRPAKVWRGFGGDGPHSVCVFVTFDLLFWGDISFWGLWGRGREECSDWLINEAGTPGFFDEALFLRQIHQ